MSGELEKLVQKRLDGIAKRLNHAGLLGFRRGVVSNFTASFGLFSNEADPDETPATLIPRLLGTNARVSELEAASIEGVIETIRECLLWRGDDGAHPNREYQSSEEFVGDVTRLLEDVLQMLSAFSRISWFTLDDGHPFYPVFWDFAFLCRNEKRSLVLIGSSSD